MHVAHDRVHAAFHLGVCHHEQGVGAPGEGGTGSEGYQGVHIRRTVQQALKAADKKFLVDHHDDHGEKEL